MFLQETTEEIEFRDQQEAYAILGDRDILLQSMQENFSCRMVSRGGSLAITGAAEDAAAACALVQELLFYHRQGAKLTTHEAAYGARLIREGRREELHGLFSEVLLVTAKGKEVRAKTLGQRDYLAKIRKNAVTLGVGPAGTGKTYLAVVMAVAALRNREVSRIILTRPAVEAGEHLGFLPGDLAQKVDPYLRPLYDALYDLMGFDRVSKLLEKQLIEIAPLAYMRGRTLNGAYVILDEAQNTTPEQMKMFLTRIGFGAKAVITGDLSQVDLPRNIKSGLRDAKEKLAGIEGIYFHTFTSEDVVRHPLVQKIVDAYDAAEEGGAAG